MNLWLICTIRFSFFFVFMTLYTVLLFFAFSLHPVNSSNHPSFSFYFPEFFNTLSKDRTPEVLAPAYDLIKKSFDLLLIDVQIQALQFIVQIFCLLF